MSHFIKQISIFGLGILAVGFFVVVADIVFAQSVTGGVDASVRVEAQRMITEAENALSVIKNKISEIESAGSLPVTSEPLIEVSFKEVSSKLQLSKELLDQAKAHFAREEYFKASALANSSRQNTLAFKAYFDGLTNTPGTFRFKLQGTFADILSLKPLVNLVNQVVETMNTVSPVQIPLVPVVATTTPPVIPVATSTATSTPPTPTATPTATSTPVIKLNPKAVTCITNGNIACAKSKVTCIANVNALVNTCQTTLDTALTNCERYLVRSETYLPKCDTNRDLCLASGKTAIVCNKSLLTCQTNAATSKQKDLVLYKTCQETAQTNKITCDANFDVKIATRLATCQTNELTCQDTKEAACIVRFP